MLHFDQAAERELLWSLLGDLPDRNRPISAETVLVEEREDYVLEKLVLDLNGIEPVPAFFVKPKGSAGEPRPTILYNHWHAGQYDLGKRELLEGNKGLQDPPYAVELTRRGYNALAIDDWAFGERRGRTESEIFKHMLWHGQVMWGMMAFDKRAGGGLPGHAARRGRRAAGDARHQPGQHHGLVGGGAGRADQGLRGHLLPDRLPHAH